MVALASLCGLGVVGCGGSEYDAPVLGGGVIGGTSPFAGRKVSTVALSGGKTGTLDFVVDAANRCTGTLAVSGGATKQAYAFTAGLFNISGTVDPATGAFTMTGNIPGSGAFSIGGTLPSATTVGGYTLTANGETYTSTFAPVASPTPGATPTPTPSASPAPSSGGAVTFTVLSKSADCNVTESKLSNLTIKSATVSAVNGGVYAFSSALDSGDTSFSLGWLRLADPDGLTPETQAISTDPQIGAFGDPFQTAIYTGIQMPAGVGLSYGGYTLPGAGVWRPKSGTIVIESVVGKTVVVRGENVVFEPTPAPTNSGTGTFTTNFRVTYSNVGGL